MLDIANISDKKQARKAGLRARRALTAAERAAKSEAIAKKLLASCIFQKAQTVFCYVASEDEVHTRKILQAVLASGKRLCIPYIVDAQNGLMYAAELKDLSDLVPGLYDIPTVPTEGLVKLEPAEIDMVIVPGSAFDMEGHRIGMGGGYYDRFLHSAEATITAKVAIAYQCQLAPHIAVEEHDEKMHYIFTEDELYCCK